MTLRAVGFGPRFPRAWLLPITAMTLLLAFAVGGYLSRSIVADLIAWWPVWLAVAIGAYLFRTSRLGAVRAAGLIPLVALVLVLVFAWGHIAGWEVMPSAAQHLVGPTPDGLTAVSMTIGVDGEVLLGGGADTLYSIDPIRRGGTVGMPTATELSGEGVASISLNAPDDPGVYVYAGWDVRISADVVWDLDIDAAVDADLASTDVSRLTLAGAGTVILGPAADATNVVVEGRYDVIVPGNTPVRVIGAASVPANWNLADGGAVSPVLGTGWILTVIGDGVLTVRER